MILEALVSEILLDQETPPLLPKVERFADRAADEFANVLDNLAESVLTRDAAEHERQLKRVTAYIAGILTLSNLLGRRSILINADKVNGGKVGMSDGAGVRLAYETPPEFSDEVPKVEFAEAINDLVTREPRIYKTSRGVARAYATRHAFALSHVTDRRVTKRVQDEVVKSLREGRGVAESRASIRKILEGVEGYHKAYAETVFRTNAWTAFTAGQFQQAEDPEVASLIPCFEFNATNDSDVRPNHWAAHGMVAPTKDQIWNQFSPPLGFNCRCDIVSIDFRAAREMGLYDKAGNIRPRIPLGFRNASPDPGFGLGRPGHGIPVGV